MSRDPLPFCLRPDVELLRSGPQTFQLRDPRDGRTFQFGAEERYLLHLLSQHDTCEAVAQAQRAKFGDTTSARQVRDFLQQVRDFGLEAVAGQTYRAAGAIAGEAIAFATLPGPMSLRARGRVVNLAFDLLALAFGWLVSPVVLVAALALVFVAACVGWHQWEAMKASLDAAWYRYPVFVLILLSTLQTMVLLNLPHSLYIGMSTRRLGGRVEQFGLTSWRNVIPLFHADTGLSMLLLGDRQRRQFLWGEFLFPLVALAFYVICWRLSADHPLAQTFFVLMIPSCLMAFLLLQCNPFMPHAAYCALCNWRDDWRIQERALAETKAWLWGNASPEALAHGERFWFRLYGLCYYVGRAVIDVGVLIILPLYWATILSEWDATIFALATVSIFCAVQGWGLWSFPNMVIDRLGWLIRGGGPWYVRWPIRLAVLAGIIYAGFWPYKHEVGGDYRLMPVAEYPIRAQIQGELAEVRVKPGDIVTSESVVARLHAREQENNVETTKAALDEAQATLDMAIAGPRKEEIEQALHEVALHRTRLDYYQKELTRVEGLATTRTVSEAELENARFDRDSSEKLLASAQEKLALLTNGTREEQIRAAKANVERLTAQLAYYEKELKLAQVMAPHSNGQLLAVVVPARPGQYVAPGDLLAVLDDASQLRIEIFATEDAAVMVEPGQLVKLRMGGYFDGELLTARVVEKAKATVEGNKELIAAYRTDREGIAESRAGEHDRRFVQILAELEQPVAGLVPYMTGKARIVIDESYFWREFFRPVVRFFRTDFWSWLP